MSCEIGVFVVSRDVAFIVDAESLCRATQTARHIERCYCAVLVAHKAMIVSDAVVVPDNR
jgi:hypothetical protein